MTGIPGYLGTVTINTEDVSAIGMVVSVNYTKNTMSRPTFGGAWTRTLGGVKAVQFSANGILDAAKASALQTAYAADAPVAFSLQAGAASQATDAGVHSGNCIISSLNISANADGEYEWSITAASDGTVSYTAGAGDESSSSSSSSS